MSKYLYEFQVELEGSYEIVEEYDLVDDAGYDEPYLDALDDRQLEVLSWDIHSEWVDGKISSSMERLDCE